MLKLCVKSVGEMSAKLEQIQGVRALAIFGVFLTHTIVWLADDLGRWSLLAARYGGASVVTFFMLSGFLLSFKKNIVPTLTGEKMVMTAWRKVSKMYGLFIITMVIAFLSNMPSGAKGWLQAAICVPFQLTLTQAFVPISWITHAFNGPAWFLSALFGIWLLVYLCHRGINKIITLSANKCVVVLGIVICCQLLYLCAAEHVVEVVLCKSKYLMWSKDWLIYSNPILCFSEFLAGVLFGQVCSQKRNAVVMQNIFALIGLSMVIISVFVIILKPIKINVPWIVIAECMAGVGLLSAISPRSIGYQILSIRPLVWFGNISAYFYLIHSAVNYSMRATVATYIPKPWLFFMSFAISTMLAACTNHYYGKK